MMLKIKRAYDAAEKSDGTRILVDRLWPRGLSKAKAGIDLWLKEIAPTDQLRKWFAHDPGRWDEFKRRYTAELKENEAALAVLKKEAEKGPVTLVYGTKDKVHNNAVVLQKLATDL